jgi:hypothetical protein
MDPVRLGIEAAHRHEFYCPSRRLPSVKDSGRWRAKLFEIETHGSTRILVIRNADTSFVYFARQDGALPAVPAEDRVGRPHDFSKSATLQRAHQEDLVGQGTYDGILGTAHLGILNSPETWGIAFDFITDPSPRR